MDCWMVRLRFGGLEMSECYERRAASESLPPVVAEVGDADRSLDMGPVKTVGTVESEERWVSTVAVASIEKRTDRFLSSSHPWGLISLGRPSPYVRDVSEGRRDLSLCAAAK